jgi:hypothetical protein
MKNKLLLSLLLLSSSLLIKAQGSIGLQSGTTYFWGLRATPTVGLMAVSPGFNTGNILFQYGFNYHLPFTMNGTEYAYPIYNSYLPNILVHYTNKINIYEVNACARLYFGDNSFEDGGVYGLIGFGASYMTSKMTPDSYDDTNYRLDNYFSTVTAECVQPYISLGVAYDKILVNDHIFGAQLLADFGSKMFPGGEDELYLQGFISIKVTYSLPIGN